MKQDTPLTQSAGTSGAARIDPVDLTRALIRCPSVTPKEGGALDLLEGVLSDLGFACHRLVFSAPGTPDVDNLYARIDGVTGGEGGRNFCFAGHSDVVPVGDPSAWRVDPFAAEVLGAELIGRGAVDMKGAIAAFAAAAAGFLEARGGAFGGAISLLITGDEEGPAVNGTVKVLDWLTARGERLDACLVGEPTSDRRLGDTVKIGRRGSLSGHLVVQGTQGHVAYPDLADNPVHHLLRMLGAVTGEAMDQGSDHFPPTSLQVTSIDVGNPTGNLIPARAGANFNVRFNDRFTGASVEAWVRARFDHAIGPAKSARYDLETRLSGESFLTPPGPLSDLVAGAVAGVTGAAPVLGTTGGTSDARFIKDHCPVVELGLSNATAHQVDERVGLDDLRALSAIYRAVLDGYFAP